MQNFDFTDSAFDPSGTGFYDLSLFCGSDGLTILLHESASGELLLCRHHSFRSSGYQVLLRKVREIISGEKILQLPYGKTTIFMGEKQVVLIPEQLYSVKMAEILFPPLKKHDSGMESIVVPVQQPGALLMFRTGKDMYDYLSLTFPGAGITHAIFPLLQQTSGQEGGLRFHLHDSWFYAVAEKDGKVNFVNSFEFRSEKDMLYYMLAVNGEFNPERFPVRLSGWMDTEDPRIALIRRYIPGMIWLGDKGQWAGKVEDSAFQSFSGLIRSQP